MLEIAIIKLCKTEMRYDIEGIQARHIACECNHALFCLRCHIDRHIRVDRQHQYIPDKCSKFIDQLQQILALPDCFIYDLQCTNQIFFFQTFKQLNVNFHMTGKESQRPEKRLNMWRVPQMVRCETV